MRFYSSTVLATLVVGMLLPFLQGCNQASGMGQYCSVTDASAAWDFSWTGTDPCQDILTNSVPGGTIERAGLYSLSGENRVVLRCENNFVSAHRAVGALAMAYARNIATRKELNDCIITVAPKEMPIFDSPFDIEPSFDPATGAFTYISPGTGFDFAKPPYDTLNVQNFGQSGPTSATIVNNRGEDRSSTNFIDNHDAYDWGIERNTPLYAVANGQVVKARNFTTTCSGSDSPTQGEVYIKHTVYGDNLRPGTYKEEFISSYFHLSSLAVADGHVVTKGQLIGYSGNTGCSSGPHLHFAVMRLTNTANNYKDSLTIDSGGNDGWRIVIDPYGFDSIYGFDPWGVQAFNNGWGALSINLWNEGEAPITGNW